MDVIPSLSHKACRRGHTVLKVALYTDKIPARLISGAYPVITEEMILLPPG